QEVVSAFEQRMRLLQSENVMSYIKPIEDEVIFRLYDLYNGDIRSIMSAIRDIIGQYGDKLVTPPLSLDQAMLLLGHERVAQIERATTLSESQMEVLRFFVQNGKELSQADASRLFGKSPSNISSYYFKPLKEAGIIEEKRREGKSVFWGLTTHYEPLKWVYGSRVEVHKEIEKSAKAQPSLFEEMRT
ncbi:MAG TPA: helix-turn-helix domain-containing protein, partial [Candidatus Paceibacterota bacterium]|nr:helix-turn-helix domain-containing protein [Candidatus Paceibacterota bacterium]